MVKLNIFNLHELRCLYRTETANYVYAAEPREIGVYRLLRRRKKSTEVEVVRMPEIYRGFFKKWRWED